MCTSIEGSDFSAALPVDISEHASSDPELTAQIAEVESITKTLKDAVDADVETSVLKIWAKIGWIFWSLTLKEGKASGMAKAPVGVSGTGKFWTTQLSIPPSAGPGEFNLEIKSVTAHLSLKSNDGTFVGDYTFGGFGQKTLVGSYEGSWKVSP